MPCSLIYFERRDDGTFWKDAYIGTDERSYGKWITIPGVIMFTPPGVVVYPMENATEINLSGTDPDVSDHDLY